MKYLYVNIKIDWVNPFLTSNFFYTPSKHQKTSGFFKLSGGIREIPVTKLANENICKAHNKI